MLAVHREHQAAPHFPDGQLYADLRGYSDGEPTTPKQALRWPLPAVGVPAAAVPHAGGTGLRRKEPATFCW